MINYASMEELERRLREFMAATGLTQARMVEIAKTTDAAVSQWLGAGSKPTKTLSIGPAVRLERETGWSSLWLALGEGPKQVAPKVVGLTHVWPFRLVSQDDYNALEPEERGVAQDAMRKEVSRLLAERKKRQAG